MFNVFKNLVKRENIIIKAISTLLAIMLMSANFIILETHINNGMVSYAADSNLNQESGADIVNDENSGLSPSIEDMEPEATYTDASVDVSKERISSTNNKDVELKVTLHKNNVKYDLYKNPVIFIEFPSFVRNVNIKDLNLMYADGLKIDFDNIAKSLNDRKSVVITIPLKGNQTKYSTENIIGTQIILNMDIAIKEMIPTIDSKINVYIHNEIAEKYARIDENNKEINGLLVGYSYTDFSYIARAGIMTKDILSNFDDRNSVVKTSENNNNKAAARLATYKNAKIAHITSFVLNNYKKDLDNVAIIGRIATKGNKSSIGLERLNSTFNTKLASKIKVNGIDENKVEIYYSSNKDATYELENPENAWTKKATSSAKSFLIVAKDYVMEQGKTISFGYDFQIPANLDFNEESYIDYAILFNNEESSTFENVETAGIRLFTGDSLGLKVNVEASADTNIVHEEERITYSVQIENESEEDIENVTVMLPIPDGTTYLEWERVSVYNEEEDHTYYSHYEYKEYPDAKGKEVTIPKIKAGKTETLEAYIVKVNKIPDGQVEKNIEHVVSVKVEGLNDELKETNTVVAKKAKFNAEITYTNGNNAFVGEETNITAVIRNVSGEELKDIEFTSIVPDGIEYVGHLIEYYMIEAEGTGVRQIEEGFTYDSNTRTITCKIDELAPNAQIHISIFIKGKLLDNEQLANNVTWNGKVKANNVEAHRLSPVSFDIVNLLVKVLDFSNTEDKTVLEGDWLQHKILITNNSLRRLEDVKIEIEIPEGTEYLNSLPRRHYQVNNKLIWEQEFLNPGETIEYEVNINTNTLPAGVESRLLDFKTKISALNVNKDIDATTTYTLKSNGEGVNPTNPVDPTDPTNPTKPVEPTEPELETYRIIGTAWVDENRNGAKDDGEKVLSDVQVLLLDAKTEQKLAEAITDNQGMYMFSGLKNGEYLVAFKYDAGAYGITTYKKSGVSEDINSKVTKMDITIDGDKKVVGITDKIVINNSDVASINMGVTEAKFDLSLDKYISKATIQNEDGKVVYEYDSKTGKTAKIDIRGKYLNGTVAVLEYSILVTNNGDISGYVKSIVDYIPKGLTFKSELNSNWYQDKDNNLYCLELANDEIKPGETKVVNLKLIKTMTRDNVGLTSNSAEIYEDYNEYGVKDMNSTPGNKEVEENDYSTAEIIITIRTGSTVMYIGVAIVCMAILGRWNIHY